jgi:hypothetical protein
VIERDDDLCGALIDRCRAFHETVASGVMPPLDDSVATYEAVRAQHPDPGATWNDGVNVAEVAGGATSAVVPLMTGTYMAKFRDSTGHWSAAAATWEATQGMVTGWTVADSVTEDPGFGGTKTDVEVSGGALQLVAGTPIDDITDLLDTWTDIDGGGPLFAEFDTRYLLSGSMADRSQWARTMTEMGIWTRNEIRDAEGKDPLPGLDEPLTPLNMAKQGTKDATQTNAA